MYRLDREEFTRYRYLMLWSLLGFQAGFINAFGFLACGRYVSHVTGFGTQIGVAVAEKDFLMAFELLGFPLSFIVGSFSSAFFTSARLERGLVPRYGLTTGTVPIAIGVLFFMGLHGYFGVFGEPLLYFHDFLLLFLLSFVCGLQNGCFATLTKGQIRTTHLTGISTDIGTDLARLWFGELSPREHEMTFRTNLNRIATVFSFATGSVLSVAVSRQIAYSALIVPLLTATIVFFAVKRVQRALDEAKRNE